MELAVVRGLRTRVERHSIAEDDPATPQAIGQQFVRRSGSHRCSTGGPNRRGLVRLTKEHIERNCRGAQVAQPLDKATDYISPPWPSPDRRQAAFVDVYDHDSPVWR
jgi:hypothetical protein